MISLLGLLAAQVIGSLARAVLSGLRLGDALRSPSSTFYALAIGYGLALGWPGLAVLSTMAASAFIVREAKTRREFNWLAIGALGFLVLARRWVPTGWDEFVWLGKARFEAQGFGAGIGAALDPTLDLIPTGYPPLWPAAVGWLALGRDALDAQVVAASLLVVLSAAAALEAWFERERKVDVVALAALATPLVWVHLRSTYVDLPVGLLGVALLGQLLRGGAVAVPMAIVLVAFKDEGAAHVLAATVAAVIVSRRWRDVVPAIAAVTAVMTWKVLVRSHGVEAVDHALSAPYWPWTSTLLKLFVLHATDVWTWGIFWAVAAVCALDPERDSRARAVRVMMLCCLALQGGALLAGPERVRVFAESGTLINRLLLQLWPAGALIMLTRRRAETLAGSASKIRHLG